MLSPFQEYIFRLEPGKVDSGKGKCPYDPKLNSVSALISTYLSLSSYLYKASFPLFQTWMSSFFSIYLSTSLYLPYAHSILADGQLYAGVYIDFMGTDSAIFRTLGKHTAMRTDQYNSRWLHGMHKMFEPWRTTKKKFFV